MEHVGSCEGHTKSFQLVSWFLSASLLSQHSDTLDIGFFSLRQKNSQDAQTNSPSRILHE